MDLRGAECVAYVRVSTERQATDDRSSLADQERAVREFAARLGRTIAHVYRDEGASGATAEQRPAFMQLLADCAAAPRSARTPGVVLVLNHSRFGRFPDPEEAAYWRVHLEKMSGWVVQFAEHDESADMTTRTLMRAIHGVSSSAYREALKRNVQRGMRGSTEQGFWTTMAPFGYQRRVVFPVGRERDLGSGARKAPDERVKLVPVANEAAMVREVFERYASGEHSISSLVEWALVALPARRWTRAAVRYMLSNPAYAGDVVFGRTPADPQERKRSPRRPDAEWYGRSDAHEAIIDRATWARVQARLADHQRRTRGVRSDWVLSGLVRCRCGAAFGAGGWNSNTRKLQFYRCVTRGLHPSGRCEYGGSVAKHLLEAAVVDELARVVSAPRTRRHLAELVDAAIASLAETPSRRAEELLTEQRSLESKRDRLVGAVAEGTVTTLEAQRKLTEYRSRLADLAAQRAMLSRGASVRHQLTAERDRLVALASSFPMAAQTLTGPALRALIAPWIRHAEFNTSTRILTLEVRRLPAIGMTGDMVMTEFHPDRKRSPESLVVRRVVVGRGR